MPVKEFAKATTGAGREQQPAKHRRLPARSQAAKHRPNYQPVAKAYRRPAAKQAATYRQIAQPTHPPVAPSSQLPKFSLIALYFIAYSLRLLYFYPLGFTLSMKGGQIS